MVITDIKIRKILQSSRLRAIVSVTLDGQLAIHDIKVIEGPQRLFVSMPSKREADGVFRDIVHPINHTLRQDLEEKVLAAYEGELQAQQANQPAEENQIEGPQE